MRGSETADSYYNVGERVRVYCSDVVVSEGGRGCTVSLLIHRHEIKSHQANALLSRSSLTFVLTVSLTICNPHESSIKMIEELE